MYVRRPASSPCKPKRERESQYSQKSWAGRLRHTGRKLNQKSRASRPMSAAQSMYMPCLEKCPSVTAGIGNRRHMPFSLPSFGALRRIAIRRLIVRYRFICTRQTSAHFARGMPCPSIRSGAIIVSLSCHLERRAEPRKTFSNRYPEPEHRIKSRR